MDDNEIQNFLCGTMSERLGVLPVIVDDSMDDDGYGESRSGSNARHKN